MLVTLCGLPVTGKTTAARQLAEDTNGKILRTDVIRRKLFEESTLEEVMNSDDPMRYDLERIFDDQETIPEKYQEMIWKQKKMVYDELFRRIEVRLTERQTVILDGTFYKRSLRERVYSIARKTDARVYLVECNCSEDYIKERLSRRKEIPDEASNVDKLKIYYTVKESYERPTDTGDPVPTIIYDTGLQEIETHNTEQGDEELGVVINSINKLIKRFS